MCLGGGWWVVGWWWGAFPHKDLPSFPSRSFKYSVLLSSSYPPKTNGIPQRGKKNDGGLMGRWNAEEIIQLLTLNFKKKSSYSWFISRANIARKK